MKRDLLFRSSTGTVGCAGVERVRRPRSDRPTGLSIDICLTVAVGGGMKFGSIGRRKGNVEVSGPDS